MPRLLGLFVALLVLVGLGSTFLADGSRELLPDARVGETSQPDTPATAATLEQATHVSDPDPGADGPACPAESDDDDDNCNEESAAPSRFSVSVSLPMSTHDPLPTCGIRPSQGHGAGPEKPPRA